MSIKEHFLTKGFKRLISSNNLGHAYLLFGESEVARRDVILSILKLLENKNDSKDSQDFLHDGLIINKDSSGSIGIEVIRNAINFLWQSPVVSSRRSIFINNADCLTSQAENALLKTVEEPPIHGLIMASVLGGESLAVSLASRFQKIFVFSPSFSSDEYSKEAQKFIHSTASVRKFLIAQVLEQESYSALLDFVRALLVECHKDPLKNFELMRRLTDRWAKMCQFNLNKKLQLETLLV